VTDTPNLAAALAAVQADLPPIAKGETATVQTKQGGSYRYSYADLADVSQVILPLLGKRGLSWITRPTIADGRFVLAYELLHTSGESRTGEYPLPDRGTPQEIGSAITYARRYALCAVTGVAPAADDDDGAAATQRAQREPFEDARPARPDPERVRQNILANARQAIDSAPRGELHNIQERIDGLVARQVITAVDHVELTKRINARRGQLDANRARSLPAEDRTAETADEAAVEPDGQQPMDAEWPTPATPGGNNPT